MSLEPDIILSDVVSAGSTGGLLSIYSDTKFVISVIVQSLCLVTCVHLGAEKNGFLYQRWTQYFFFFLHGYNFQASGKKHINMTVIYSTSKIYISSI